MATIAASQLGPGTLTIGETGTPQEFASQLTACTLEPSFDTGDSTPVLSGDEIPGDTTESASLKGTMLQDYSGMNSTLVYCRTNSGQQLPFKFVPATSGGLGISGTLTMRSVSTGGDVKKKNTSDFEWPVSDWQYIDTSDTGA